MSERTTTSYGPENKHARLEAFCNAIRNGNVDDVVSILRAGSVDKDATFMQGWSPLLLACHHSREPVVQVLLEAGADVNRAAHDGMTPLMFAASKKSLRNVFRLLHRGADVRAEAKTGWTAFDEACQAGDLTIVKLLRKHGSELERLDRTSPLWIAASAGHEHILQYLIGRGANIDCVDKHGTSALVSSTFNARLACMELLAACGADFYVPSRMTSFALDAVCSDERVEALDRGIRRRLLGQALAFCAGSQSRLGQGSAVQTEFFQSRIFEKKLIAELFQFLDERPTKWYSERAEKKM